MVYDYDYRLVPNCGKQLRSELSAHKFFEMGKYSKVTRGHVEALLNKIGGEQGMNAILSGRATIAYREHMIDLDADPRIPCRVWKVHEHKKGGQFKWDASKVKLFLHDKQRDGSINGIKLRKELANKPCYNANLLDYLLDNPNLIPEEWQGGRVCFWGTIYRDFRGDDLFVRCLVWEGGHWKQEFHVLFSDNFGPDRPYAVAAS